MVVATDDGTSDVVTRVGAGGDSCAIPLGSAAQHTRIACTDVDVTRGRGLHRLIDEEKDRVKQIDRDVGEEATTRCVFDVLSRPTPSASLSYE